MDVIHQRPVNFNGKQFHAIVFDRFCYIFFGRFNDLFVSKYLATFEGNPHKMMSRLIFCVAGRFELYAIFSHWGTPSVIARIY